MALTEFILCSRVTKHLGNLIFFPSQFADFRDQTTESHSDVVTVLSFVLTEWRNDAHEWILSASCPPSSQRNIPSGYMRGRKAFLGIVYFILLSMYKIKLNICGKKSDALFSCILLEFCRCSVGFKSQRCDQKENPCDHYCQNEGMCTLTAFNEPRCK